MRLKILPQRTQRDTQSSQSYNTQLCELNKDKHKHKEKKIFVLFAVKNLAVKNLEPLDHGYEQISCGLISIDKALRTL
ncbi:hypothetical protein SAMN05444397_101219 [Flavobacterium aquidurense]|uniref:Uncharacterized protein n=1 Tax=Flavobacterium frigidimaris TaxID=262320 RepID=A0ABX4BP52_FLAFR|nr:hypothetical protein B0A65_13920 [Flavobacterium frigidimaris]SDY27509.1 hypothetical protein SAMN05444397_101219 [Flavobacterium aquidurense]